MKIHIGNVIVSNDFHLCIFNKIVPKKVIFQIFYHARSKNKINEMYFGESKVAQEWIMQYWPESRKTMNVE